MSSKMVTVTFSTDGKVKVEGVGFTGPECEEEIDQVLRDLNLKIEAEQLKDEYFINELLTGNI